jgi:hypothetical protein
MKRHAETAAWDLYAAANPEAFDSSTLGRTGVRNVSLINRIERAFRAGVEFQKRRYRKKRKAKQ